MTQRALGPQFHATLAEHAPAIVREGFKLVNRSGYGNAEPVHHHGPGVYTADAHNIDHWQGSIRSSPFHEREPQLATLAVEHPPDARIHVVDSDHWHSRGGQRLSHEEGVKRHLAAHPDLAPHYDATKGNGFGMADISHAARAAGYDAVHFDRPEASETVWFDPSKLKASERPTRRVRTQAENMAVFEHQKRRRQELGGYPVGTQLPPHEVEAIDKKLGLHGIPHY